MAAPAPDEASLRGLGVLLRAELAAGIFGLKLFVASVAVAASMLGVVWLLADGLVGALQHNARGILGGDIAATVVNRPLDRSRLERMGDIGAISRVVELRASAVAGDRRAPVELKAVDAAYPLYGSVRIASGDELQAALSGRDGLPGAVVEPALLERLGIAPGDPIVLGGQPFEVRGGLLLEPDRLSAGSFLIGPRVLVSLSALDATGLTGPASLAEYRYRLRLPPNADPDAAMVRLRAIAPDHGWELERSGDAGERVQRIAERTTTFLGVAGLAALAAAQSAAWAATTVWVARRRRTIALYRLAGATPPLVVALHAVIIAAAGAAGIALGLGLAVAAGLQLMALVAAELQLEWNAADAALPLVEVAAIELPALRRVVQ
ncbi:MAG: ABC transporter permease, partial [Acetobacterales bacterium]